MQLVDMVVEKYKVVSAEDYNRIIANIQRSGNNPAISKNLGVEKAPKDVQNIYLQQAIQTEAEKTKQKKEEPINVKVVNHEPTAKFPSTVNNLECFDAAKFLKPGQRILQFFLDNGTTCDEGVVTFNGNHISKTVFDDGIRKLSNGRFKVTPTMFPHMMEFLMQKRFPTHTLPTRHQSLFSPLIPIEPSEKDEIFQPLRKRLRNGGSNTQTGGKIKKIKWISNHFPRW